MSTSRIPGVYAKSVKNDRKVKVKGLALPIMLVDSNKGDQESFDLITSPSEMTTAMGEKERFNNQNHFIAATSIISVSRAMQLLRVNAAGTAMTSKLVMDAGTAGSGSGGGGGGAGSDEWFAVPLATHMDVSTGTLDGSAIDSDADGPNTVVDISLAIASVFQTSEVLAVRVSHTVPFPIQLRITDALLSTYSNLGYTSEDEVDYGIESIQRTGAKDFQFTVVGNFPFTITQIEFLVASDDVSSVQSALGL